MIFGNEASPSQLSLSRRNLLLLGGLTTAAAVTGWVTSPAAFATDAQLDLTFENGSLGSPITKYVGASLGAGYAHTGSYGCRLDPATTTNHVACLEVDRRGFALGQPYATFSMWFRLVTVPNRSDTYMNLFEIGSTSTAAPKSRFTVSFRKNRLVCDFDWNETLDLGPLPEVGEWHQIQAIVHFGATLYTAHVSLDGGSPVTLTSADDKTPQYVKILWVHYPATAVDYTMDVDEIKMSTSATAPDFLDPPAAGPAAAGFNESFEAGAVGSQPTAANTAYDQSIGDQGDSNGTIAAAFVTGGVAGHCVNFWNTSITKHAFGFLGKRVGMTKAMYFRRYYKLDVLPRYRMSVLLYKYGGTGNGQLGGTHNGSFAFGGGGQSYRFTLVNNNTNTAMSAATVPLNSWFRVETKVDFTSGAGYQTVRLFLGDNVNGTIPDETLTAPLTGGYTDYVEDGILTNPNVKVNVYIDEATNGSKWLGPVS